MIISLNTKYENNLYKLLNNSVFGKRIQNKRKQRKLGFATNERALRI